MQAKQLPIPFTADNALKVQQDLKTQSRRLINLLALQHHKAGHLSFIRKSDGSQRYAPVEHIIETYSRYQVGDHLWIQEPYQFTHVEIRTEPKKIHGYYVSDNATVYTSLEPPERLKFFSRKYPYRKTAARFMYKSLARTWVEVIDIRIQRVNEISEMDAIAEGVQSISLGEHHWANYLYPDHPCISPQDSFASLWDSIHVGLKPKPADEWKQFINGPYVWAYTFQKIDNPNK